MDVYEQKFCTLINRMQMLMMEAGYSFINMDKVTDAVKTLYEENGGNPHLDGAYSTSGTGHTVFAQVFEGMDVVDAIAGVSTGDNDKPRENVVMEQVEIVPL